MAHPYPYAPPYPVPPKPPRRLKGPVVLGVVGVLVVAVGIAMWVGAAFLFGDAVSSASSTGERVRDDMEAELAVPGSTEVELGTGTFSIYALVPTDAGTGPTTTSELGPSTGVGPGPAPDLDVTVTAADGTSVLVDEPFFPDTWTDTDTDTDLEEVAEVEIVRSGTYTVTVAEVSGAEPVARAGIGPQADYTEAVGKGLGGGLLVFLGFLVGGIGGVILLIALIWLLIAALA